MFFLFLITSGAAIIIPPIDPQRIVYVLAETRDGVVSSENRVAVVLQESRSA